MVMAVMLAWMPLNAKRAIDVNGDTLIIARDNDTIRIANSRIMEKLGNILDDTVVNISDEVDCDKERDAGWRVTAIESQQIWAHTAQEITIVVVWGLVALTVAILLFNYLKRRRKYKMVEKAIENNYPLPPYIFDGNSPTQPMYGTTVVPPVQGTPIDKDSHNESTATDSTAPTPPPINAQSDPWNAPTSQQPTVGTPRINWHAFQSSFILVAVGLGLMIVFHETPLMGIFSILVLIGLGKGFIEYQEQRDAIDAWRKRK